MAGETNDLLNSKLGRTILLITLLGAGAGNYRLSTVDVSDRFKGSDFTQQIGPRDRDIKYNSAAIRALERDLALHLQHSAKYTQIIEGDQAETREIRRDLKTHLREEH